MIDLILIKINESKDEGFSKEDLIRFIENLDFKLSELDEKEVSSILKSDEKVDVKKMIQVIIEAFQYARKNMKKG